MPGFLAIGARGVDFCRLGITFEGPGPLVTGEKVCRSAYIAGGHVSGVVPGPGRRPNGMLASPGPGLAVCDEGHAWAGPL